MNPKIAIETCSPGDLDNNDVILNGITNIDKANYQFSEAQYYNAITNDNNISKVIGLGPSNKFFYNLSAYQDNNIRCYEKGIGYAYEHNNKLYFKRELPLIYGKNADHAQLVSGPVSKFYFPEEDSTVIISSEVPPNLALLYFSNNSVLIAKDAFKISTLQIPNDSCLATFNDVLSSLSFNSLEFSEYVANALALYSKALSLKTSRLESKQIATKQLRLQPADQANAKKGTLIYDESSDTIQFYNGQTWRKLKWEDANVAE